MQMLTAKIDNYPMDDAEVRSWEGIVDAQTSWNGYFAYDVTERTTTLEIYVPADTDASVLLKELYKSGAFKLEMSSH